MTNKAFFNFVAEMRLAKIRYSQLIASLHYRFEVPQNDEINVATNPNANKFARSVAQEINDFYEQNPCIKKAEYCEIVDSPNSINSANFIQLMQSNLPPMAQDYLTSGNQISSSAYLGESNQNQGWYACSATIDDMKMDRQNLAYIYVNSIKSNDITDNDETLAKKLELVDRLTAYKKRIESHTTRSGATDFEYGFSFFKGSQGYNRRVNYHLADLLITSLVNSNLSINEIFCEASIASSRDESLSIMKLNSRSSFWNLGIKSNELSEIIQLARNFQPASDSDNCKSSLS